MRMHMRRFTRLTNAFSKKVENHAYAVALHMMYYNFVRLHSKLRVSPAMAAGVSDKLWEVSDIVVLVEVGGSGSDRKRGTYKKTRLKKGKRMRLAGVLFSAYIVTGIIMFGAISLNGTR